MRITTFFFRLGAVAGLWLVLASAHAQLSIEWQAGFGGTNSPGNFTSGWDNLYSAQPTGDGGYILGGDSNSGVSGNKTTPNFGFPSSDLWLVKVDDSGNKQWEQAFGGSNNEEHGDVRPTSDGGYILGGSSLSSVSGNKTTPTFGNYDFWLVKVDGSGNKQWEQDFGGSLQDFLLSVQPTSDGGYILGGISSSGVSGNKTTPNFGIYDYWLVKVDGSGNKQWEQDFGGSGNDTILNDTETSPGSVQPTSDGGYILGCSSDSGVSGNKTSAGFGGYDYWVVKVDGSGNKQWEQVFGGSGDEILSGVQPTSDGGFILHGSSSSGVSGNKTTENFGGSDYWLVKVDGSGNKQWEQVFGGSGNDKLQSVQPTTDGGYILGGYSASGVSGNKTTPNFSSDYWLVKVDASGNKQWEQVIGGSNVDHLQSVQPTSDGGYILGGWSFSGVSGDKTTPNFGGRDYWAVKLKPPPFLLTARSFTNGNFTLQLSGLSGQSNVVISASTNLTDWTPIFTNPPVTGSLEYVDSPPANCPQRFYRAAEK